MSREHPSLAHMASPAGLPSEKSTSSFWHTEPSPLLLAHRSTRNVPQTADVVVIGSGITGTSVAHHLLTTGSSNGEDNSEGLDVVMLEAREACWGATGRNGGHCQPLLFEQPRKPEIGHFELANFSALQNTIEERNIECEFVAQPGVRAIYSQHHLEEAREALSIMEESAPELRKMMKFVTEKDELVKYRIPTAEGAIVTSVAARLWPYKLVSHLLEHLLTSNTLSGSFNLQTLTPVSSIAPHESPEGWTVHTDRGSIIAKKVVLATNAYTSHLLPGFKDLIVPCRGQMSALEPLPSLQGADKRLKTSLGFLGDGLDDYLIQRPSEKGGHMMFGGGRQHGPSIGVTDDSVLDEKTAKYLRSRLVSALGLPEGHGDEHAEFEAVREWTGIMGFSRDEHPWIGQVPHPFGLAHPSSNSKLTDYSKRDGLYIAAGFTGHGMPNTWLCGKAVAKIVLKSLGFASVASRREALEDEVKLPDCYRVSRERIARAMKTESVAAKDWAEMSRGDAGGVEDAGRPASGYT